MMIPSAPESTGTKSNPDEDKSPPNTDGRPGLDNLLRRRFSFYTGFRFYDQENGTIARNPYASKETEHGNSQPLTLRINKPEKAKKTLRQWFIPKPERFVLGENNEFVVAPSTSLIETTGVVQCAVFMAVNQHTKSHYMIHVNFTAPKNSLFEHFREIDNQINFDQSELYILPGRDLDTHRTVTQIVDALWMLGDETGKEFVPKIKLRHFNDYLSGTQSIPQKANYRRVVSYQGEISEPDRLDDDQFRVATRGKGMLDVKAEERLTGLTGENGLHADTWQRTLQPQQSHVHGRRNGPARGQ